MPRCCYAGEYAEVFPQRRARRSARRFLRGGLPRDARRLAEEVEAIGVQGRSVLEVGGGVGEVQAHLLGLGATSAVNVELSPGWEAAAGRMLGQLGLDDRVDRRLGDFVELAPELPEADLVVLHRVLCCYPDWRAMLAAALAKAECAVAITVPVDRWWTRVGVAVGNGLLALSGRRFRAFVHPPRQIAAAVRHSGLRLRADRPDLLWHLIVAERPPGAPSGNPSP